MCTGFELPAIASVFGGAEAAAGLGALAFGGDALALGALSSGTAGALGTGALLGGGGAALGGAAGAGLLGAGLLDAGGAALGGELLGGLGGFGADTFGTAAADGLAGLAFGGDALALGSMGAGLGSTSGGLGAALSTGLKYANPIMSGISGATGLAKQRELRELARMQMAKGDPWGTSGGRAGADAQLQALLRNPSAVASGDPSYALRIQGAQRAAAPMGQDSGAMAVAGANASTDWYNARLAQLSGLAGAGVSPGAGGNSALQGTIAANELLGQSLGSFGYGLGSSGSGTVPAELLALALQRRGG